MKGLGVFSPLGVTSRYVLVASGLYESSINDTPRVDPSPVLFNLLDFKVSEKVEKVSDPFSQNYENTTNFNQFPPETPFSFAGGNFDDYMSSSASSGIGEFTVLHSSPVDLPNGYLTTMKWLKLGPSHGEDKSLVAVGSNSGDVIFYDGEAFVKNKAVVSTFTSKVCNVPIKCLGYCGKNMLAIAGLDGQVSVVDLGSPSNYNVVDVSYGKWKVGMVTSLGWNYRLSHILASSGAALNPLDTSGVVVWDLKVRKPASTFRDQTGRVNPVSLDWVPDQPTQLVVGYADDNAPSLQLWDLRNCSAPISEVKAHTRGLTHLTFNPHDPSLLLTSAKDDTTKCWQLTPERNFNLVSSLQTDALSHHSRVEWHPNTQGLFLSQANDGELCIHHLFSGTMESNYMPTWTRKKAGVVSGFAGQVTTWNTTEVKSYTLASEYDSQTSKLLNNTLEVLSVLHDETMFMEFCESKASSSNNEFDKLTWQVLKCQYQGQLRNVLEVLGYPQAGLSAGSEGSVNENNEEVTLQTQDLGVMNNLGMMDARSDQSNYMSNKALSLSEGTNDDKEAEDFFNSLTLNTNVLGFENKLNNVEQTLFNDQNNENLYNSEKDKEEAKLQKAGKEKLDWCLDQKLKMSLVAGNYVGAARRCLDLNKPVESLFLAYVAGDETFMELAAKVVEKKKDTFLNLLHMLMQRDVEGVLQSSKVKDWRETLCVLYTYAPNLESFRDLAYRFGKRLVKENMYQEASISFILASEYYEVVTLWRLQSPDLSSRSQQAAHGPSGRLEERLETLLKLSVLAFSTTSPEYSSSYGAVGNEHFDDVLMELAEVFVDAGQLDKALETLNVKGSSNSEQMNQLKSKIQNQLMQTKAAATSITGGVSGVTAGGMGYHQGAGLQGGQTYQQGMGQTYQSTSPQYGVAGAQHTSYHQTGAQHMDYQQSGSTSTYRGVVPPYQQSVHQTAYQQQKSGLQTSGVGGYQKVPTSPPLSNAGSLSGVGTTARQAMSPGVTTAPVRNVSQSMTSTTTRTVPITALMSQPQQMGAQQPPAQQVGYAQSTSTLGTTRTVTTGVPSVMSSQFSNQTQGSSLGTYSSMQHTSSTSSYSSAHPTTTHPNQVTPGSLTKTTHPTTSAGAETLRTTHPSGLTRSVTAHAQMTKSTQGPGSQKDYPVSSRTSSVPKTTVPTHPMTSRPGTSTTQQGMMGANQAYVGPSSAPGAVATAVNPGMPVPWPNPTATQQLSSKTVSTQESNKLIIQSTQNTPKGEKMAKPDLDLVVTTLQSLTANLGQSKMDLDNKKNVNELINALNEGTLTSEANSLLATLCKAVSNGDNFNSNVILNNIISKLWNNQNKSWIMCLKRLVPNLIYFTPLLLYLNYAWDHAENEDKQLISHFAGMSNYPHTVSVSSERGSVSLEGEYSNQLSTMISSSLNYIYVYLYNFIDVNLYNLFIFLYNIDNSMKFCQNLLPQFKNIIDCINGSKSNNCLNQIKERLTQCETELPKLSVTYGYINWLRIETIRIMSKYKDASSFESKWIRLINAFSCSLTGLNKIESCIICIKSTIQEISESKDKFLNSINTNPSQHLKPEYCKIKCLCDNIDALLASINNIEFYTYCLKCWICKFVNSSNINRLSISQCSKYVRYFYDLFPLHSKTFQQLFYTQTLPGLKKFQSSIESFTTDLSDIIKTQNNSLCQFINKLCQYECEINCEITQVNEKIKYLENFNSHVTKCVKSYICKYISHISNHYKECHQSLLQNIETFECIRKCVESMESVLTGTRANGDKGKEASIRFVKSEFSYLSRYKSNIMNAFGHIKINKPSGSIGTINFYFTHIHKFLDASNNITETAKNLTDIKNYLSQFSGHIRNYITPIGGFIIRPLSELKRYELTISKIAEIKNNYESIKHKVKYCESSLKFELERLKSIWSNSKLLEKHLESIIQILKNYQTNLEKLTKFKEKLQALKKTKETSISKLTQGARSIISTLCRIKDISKRLECYKNSVIIMTIKEDIEHIKSELQTINDILSYVQSQLSSLGEVKFGVDCGIVNQVECCIKEIVGLIHKKYCCLSSIITNINIGEECKSLTSTLPSVESCNLSTIQQCASAGPRPQGSNSCQSCGTSTVSQDCQCCQTNCEALEKLINSAKSCGSKIQQNLDCIKKVVCKLTDDKTSDGCKDNNQCSTTVTCPASSQCPTTGATCETVQPQAATTCQQGGTKTGCDSQSNTSALIQCVSDQITKWQSTALSCGSTEAVQCKASPEPTCQSTERPESPSTCQSNTKSTNPCTLAEVKLCLDTMINKCNCTQLKDFINKNIKSLVCIFKCQIIFNFCELFCLYLGFDKSIVDYFLSCIDKLECMRWSISKILSIPGQISSQINFTKNEINKIPTLVNTMKLAINEMECAIEGVPKNQIMCSLKSNSNHLTNSYNFNINKTVDGLIFYYQIYHFSILNVTHYKSVIDRLFQSAKKIDQMFELIISTDFCKCIKSLEKANKTIELSNISVYNILDKLSTNSNDFKKLIKLDEIENTYGLGVGSNHLCLCMINKYILYPQLIKLIYIFSIDFRMLSTMSRKYDKYQNYTVVTSDLSHLFIMSIKLLSKICIYFLSRYKYGWKIGFRNDIICFCCYYQDQNYHLILTIILVMSSLIQNMWATDNHTIVTAIQSLSSLFSELKSYDFTSIKDIKKICSGNVCGLVVDKKCPVKKPQDSKCLCWCVACYNVLLAYIYLCFQFRFYKVYKELCKKSNDLCEEIKKCFEVKECDCTCPSAKNGCCLLKLALSSELCNSEKLKQLLEDCCKECTPEETCCKTIIDKVKSGQADLLLIGCKCEPETEATEVKTWCVLFNNPWGGRSGAVVIVCKCQDDKCCCLTKLIENIKGKGEALKELCENCQCQKLTESLEQICNAGCCQECLCKTLKTKFTEICKEPDCLCTKIDALKPFCEGRQCPCKDEACCRCLCCKLLVAGVKILKRACRQNLLEPYKRITIELLSGSTDKQVIRSIVNSINNRTLRITFLVKNNHSYSNTYTDHKNIANSFPSLIIRFLCEVIHSQFETQ